MGVDDPLTLTLLSALHHREFGAEILTLVQRLGWVMPFDPTYRRDSSLNFQSAKNSNATINSGSMKSKL